MTIINLCCKHPADVGDDVMVTEDQTRHTAASFLQRFGPPRLARARLLQGVWVALVAANLAHLAFRAGPPVPR
jgi:hypothetical protein